MVDQLRRSGFPEKLEQLHHGSTSAHEGSKQGQVKDFFVKFDVHGDAQTHAEEDLNSKQYESRHDRSHDEQLWFARAKKEFLARILTLVYVVTWGHICRTYNRKENVG